MLQTPMQLSSTYQVLRSPQCGMICAPLLSCAFGANNYLSAGLKVRVAVLELVLQIHQRSFSRRPRHLQGRRLRVPCVLAGRHMRVPSHLEHACMQTHGLDPKPPLPAYQSSEDNTMPPQRRQAALQPQDSDMHREEICRSCEGVAAWHTLTATILAAVPVKSYETCTICIPLGP